MSIIFYLSYISHVLQFLASYHLPFKMSIYPTLYVHSVGRKRQCGDNVIHSCSFGVNVCIHLNDISTMGSRGSVVD